MNLILHGYTGRMGGIVARLARAGFAGAQLVACVSPDCDCDGENDCYSALSHYQGQADCVVDFSNHAATGELLAYCRDRKLPVVIATTGQNDEELESITAAAREIPIFLSANMSVGVALLADLARRAAAALPDAEIEIVEIHHDRKLDVPSGTALLLAHRMQEVREDAPLVIGRHENGKRTQREIGIHSLRLGNEVGTHEIMLSTGSETITLKHKAEDRTLFAEGALTAAAFLCGKPAGLYNMQDMIG